MMKLEATRRILDQQFQFGRSPQTFPKKIFLLTGIMHFIQHAFFFLFLFPLTLLCELNKAHIYIYIPMVFPSSVNLCWSLFSVTCLAFSLFNLTKVDVGSTIHICISSPQPYHESANLKKPGLELEFTSFTTRLIFLWQVIPIFLK